MAVFESLSKGAGSRRWGSLVAAGLLSFTLYGCGGSDSVAPPPPPPPPPPPINVAAVIAAAAANPANDAAVSSSAPFAVMSGTGLAAITINSPPVIRFTVFDHGHVVTGLTSANVRFGLAKLVPGSNGSKDEWQNYIQSKNTRAGDLLDSVYATTDPRTDAQLVYNADGYYTYTFQEDITDAARDTVYNQLQIAYEPGRTHRLAMQLSYTDSAGAAIRVNPYVDFTVVNGVGVAVTNPALTRQVVNVASCNTCHDKLAIHGGGRVDTQYCVVCHNNTTVLNNSTGFTTSMTNVDLPVFIHKIHMSKELPSVITGTPYRLDTTHDFSDIGFPQDVRNCTKCHTGDTSSDPLVAVKTAQGNNWYQKPSRAVCGSCHDGIDFATSTGTTLEQAAAIAAGAADPGGNVHTSGTFALTDDSSCLLCHGTDKGLAVKLVHVNNWATPNNPSVPDGAAEYAVDFKTLTVNTSGNPVFTFKMTKKVGAAAATDVVFNAAGGAQMLDGTAVADRVARLYVAYGNTQDGVSAPSEFTTNANAYLNALWAGTGGTLSATPDASGYYTATITAITVPTTAKMVTGMILGYITQTDATFPAPGLTRNTIAKTKVATGYTARRAIVAKAKCDSCHEQLGTIPSFHGGSRNDPTTCAFCHTPNQTSSGWTAGSVAFVHGIHASAMRTVPYNWHLGSGFDVTDVGYPGNIGNCSTCHLDNTINFGTAASTAAVPNLLPYTTARGIMSTTALSNSPYVVVDGVTDYGAAGADANLVSSPITAACTACHDDALAISHIKSQGGSFYETRVAAKAKAPEACLLCHGPGKIADIKVMHGQ